MLFYVLYKQVYPLQVGCYSRFVRGIFGGGEENRTPVRKSIHTGISECSLSFPFPHPVADKQAKGLGILLYIVRAGGTLRRRSPLIDAQSESVVLSGWTAA